jgi:pimeloyl-ACP methyl ester carboxylesterase
MRNDLKTLTLGVLGFLLVFFTPAPGAGQSVALLDGAVTISENECSAAAIGTTVSPEWIEEPVLAVTLSAPRWVVESENVPAHCSVEGSMAPIDRSPTAEPILFRILLPATWNGRAAQLGGGGTNGVIPDLTRGPLPLGYATYGSDSGHSRSRSTWNLNDEAVRNFGYMQMKKTRDAATVVIERVYGQRPQFTYYIGNSQGGREALTVAQRYPADYDGIIATVPVVSLSSLQLAPTLIRLHEKPLANWVTAAKVNAIRGEFMRQCDQLDGLADGVINNYVACRAIFDVSQGEPNRDPWAAKRCPENVDPNPSDTSASACLTDGQISTLHFVYSRYQFENPMAYGARSFGMWLPNTDPSGSGIIQSERLRGQDGAAADAPLFSHLSVAGITGRLMADVDANPLDYVETAEIAERRRVQSEIVDSADPDLSRFHSRGGKMLVVIGTNDTLASPGAQLDYFQAVIDTMGEAAVDEFARFFVIPQAGHGLRGTNHSTAGDGSTLPPLPIPNTFDRLGVLANWVENGIVPGKSVVVTAGDRSLPLCSYPAYPRYVNGPVGVATSYACTTN